MFVVIVLTSLITIFILIITSITYLITLISDSDDYVNDSLSLDSHPLPGVSPEPIENNFCNNVNHHHHCDQSAVNHRNDDWIQSITAPRIKSVKVQKVDANNSISTTDENEKTQTIKGSKSSSIKDNQTNLESTKEKSNGSSSSGSNAQTIKQLYDDFDQRDVPLGGTGLHWCKTRKSLERLIKLGIPLDTVNDRHETALHVAVRRRKLQVLIGLLCHGAEVESKNENGETPLLLACKVNDLFACQLLLVFDADVNVCDNKNLSVRHYAASIANKYKNQQQLPSAAHLILAMLHEMNSKRCPDNMVEINDSNNVGNGSNRSHNDKTKSSDKSAVCTDGCAHNGTYNGNSYNRWPNFERESLYKRHLFDDILETRLNNSRKLKKAKADSTRKSRMLCIDGGGMRGVIVCQVMIEMEKFLKKPLVDYFDWIGGTSVGAFLSCALSIGVPLSKLRRVSFDVKDEVFSGNKPYNSSFLERVLKRTFGHSTRMSEVKGKKLAVTTVIADREPCQLMFFRNYKSPSNLLESCGYSAEMYDSMITAHSSNIDSPQPSSVESSSSGSKGNNTKRKNSSGGIGSNSEAAIENQMIDENDQDPLIWQAVRASAAAPFFFKPYGPYLDGGIISNNPTSDMLAEFFALERAKLFLSSRVKNDLTQSLEPLSKLDLVLSFGTGRARVVSRQAVADFGNVTASFSTVFSPVELVKSIRAIRDLFKKVMQQSCQTDDHILDRAQAWCSSLEVPYFRINPPLANIFSIDDKRDEQLINALWQTKLYMRSMKKQLLLLAELLDNE